MPNKLCFWSYIGLALIVLFILVVILSFKVTISKNTGSSNSIISNKGGLRPSCLLCVRKHIAQAIVLLSESKKGYPEHRWLAMGHLAEAEDESMRDYPRLANKIRDARLDIQDGRDVDLTSFYSAIDNMKN